jgi:hypothetical protein
MTIGSRTRLKISAGKSELLILLLRLLSCPSGAILDCKEKEADLMKMIAINGSPRKKWNTAILLQKTLEGAASLVSFH